jgi:subtilisin
MIKLKYFLYSLITFSFIFFSCSQDEEPATSSKDDECMTKQAVDNGEIIEGEYLVSLPEDSTQQSGRKASTIARLARDYKLGREAIVETIEGSRTTLLVKLTSSQADSLKRDPAVAHVEPDRIISICACFTVIEPRLVKWNINKVGYSDGSGKRAWVLDTGIDMDHPDLNIDKTKSKSFLTGVSSVEDENGHGTHVAGVIGAINNRVGTLGVASGATIVALKVLDNEGKGRLSTVLNALAYIRTNGKPGDAVNVSMGLEDASDILDKEIQALATRGIFFAVAAGNDSKAASEYSPARASGKNIYTVTAIDSLDRFAKFSNYGNDVVDFAAPGVRILSSYIDGKYAIMSGTSMATPHVTGLLLINNGKINSFGNAISDPDGVADPIAHK